MSVEARRMYNGAMRTDEQIERYRKASRVRQRHRYNSDPVAMNARKRDGVMPTTPRPDACDCCGGPPTKVRGGKCTLSVDHCHETLTFRGWLCMECNVAIGKLGDNIEGVEKALSYLKKALDK